MTALEQLAAQWESEAKDRLESTDSFCAPMVGLRMRDCAAELRAVIAAGGWISVKDALPDLDVDVLVYVDGAIEIALRAESADRQIGWYWSPVDPCEVTHWQPLLPEPPK